MTNVVLDVLKLRRIRLDYVSPPICPPQISGSGAALLLEAVDAVQPPTGVTLLGTCNSFVVWDRYDGLRLMSMSQAVDMSNPDGEYTLVVDGLPVNYVHVCSPGWWKIQVTDAYGNIGPFSSPVKVESGKTAQIAIPIDRDSHSYTLWQNTDLSAPTGTYHQVLESTRLDGAFEICATGCYKLQAITEIGVSGLSQSACRVFTQVVSDCENNFKWNWDTCSCVCEETICPTGFHFDFDRCECWCDVQACSGNFRWDSDLCDCVCDPNTCEDPSYEWDLEVCDCVLWGCPDPESFPVIADWGGPERQYGAVYDEASRIFVIPSRVAFGAQPFPPSYLTYISFVDVATNSFLGYATDTTNLIDTAAKGAVANDRSMFDNSKYGFYILINDQSNFVTWISKVTRDVVYRGINTLSYGSGIGSRHSGYDPVRGYIYAAIASGALGQNYVDISAWNVAPYGSSVAGSPWHVLNHKNGQIAYAPDLDTIYLSTWDSAGAYHKWDADSKAFTWDVGSGTGPMGSTLTCMYIPHLQILGVGKGATVWFYDLTGKYSSGVPDTLLGSATGVNGTQMTDYCYNVCSNKIYFCYHSEGGGGIFRVTPDLSSPPYSFSSTKILTPDTYCGLAFDQTTNLVYAADRTSQGVKTIDPSL